jgi:hypothetical protein
MRVRTAIITIVVVLLGTFPISRAWAEDGSQSEKGKLPHVLGATIGAPFDDVVQAYSKTSYGPIHRKENILVYPVLLTSLSYFNEREVEYWSFENKLAQMIVRFDGAELTYDKLVLALTKSYGQPRELDKKLRRERPKLKEWFSKEYSGLKVTLDVIGMPTIRYKYLPLTMPMEDAEVDKF